MQFLQNCWAAQVSPNEALPLFAAAQYFSHFNNSFTIAKHIRYNVGLLLIHISKSSEEGHDAMLCCATKQMREPSVDQVCIMCLAFLRIFPFPKCDQTTSPSWPHTHSKAQIPS
jgi:hypothetical protein